MAPIWINDIDTERLSAISGDGHMLVFSVNELPNMNKRKGVRSINITQAQFAGKQKWLHLTILIPKTSGFDCVCKPTSFNIKVI